MDMTLLEAAKASQDKVERVVAKTIVEASPILEYLPFKIINGPAYRYHREASLGTISFRGVGGTYTPDSGVINPEYEALVIMGGEVVIDNFEVEVMGNLIGDLKGTRYRMKARQAGITFSEQFFEGDTIVTEFGFDGIRKRLVGSQLMGSTVGAALSLAQLDELLDMVIGENSQKTLFMSPTMRRKVTALVRAVTGSGLINYTQDAFGRQQVAYATCPIRVIVREDDGSSFFGYDEDPGDGASDTASIYCVRAGTDYVHGISNKSLPGVKDFGETQAAPQHKGRIEWYPGLVVKHPRAAARMQGILNA